MTPRPSPRDLALSSRGGRRIYPDGHYGVIRSALLHPAPAHVAGFLGIEPGVPAIRREREHRDSDGNVLSVSVSWFHAELEAEGCVKLLQSERIPEGTSNYIEAITGRTLLRGRDRVTSVDLDEEQAAMLRVPAGSPAQHILTYWLDADSAVVELGESVSLPGQSITYDYTL